MEYLIVEKPSIVRREKRAIEQQLGVKVSVSGKTVSLDGSAFDEFVASRVVEALALGFTLKQALTLRDEDRVFRRIHIRDFTRRKELRDVRSRLIGREGKTKRTIEEISDCDVIISESDVGIIGGAAEVESAMQAAINIIRGTKQANAYRYLERMNTEKKKYGDSLGLRMRTKK
jgi:ribosomal RNA assembly protein